MQRLKVLKFGGGIFTDHSVLPAIGRVIRHEMRDDSKLIAVVSAMGNTTRNLLAMLSVKPDLRARDMLLSTGETVSVSLVADYLVNTGIQAACFTGGQAGIFTDDNFGDANIIAINHKNLQRYFQLGDVAVVAGFQGVTKNGEVTTLGFNGSDTTAFYLTYHFKAVSCTLYKDIDGIYDRDPKIHPDARLFKTFNYKEVLSNEETTGVIHHKALRLCEKMFSEEDYNPEIIIRNFDLSRKQFTTICRKPTEFYR